MINRLIISSIMAFQSLAGTAQVQDSTRMTLREHNLAEVVVNSRSAAQRINQTKAGEQKIDLQQLARIPSLFGEKDIFRSLQLLPGVKAESEASSGFQVRGGTASQNQILLDKTTLYQAGHLMGLFSTFNDEAISNATLYKGMIPAQYGGATSSVLSVDTRSGNMTDYHYGGSIGLLSAKVFAEGPIKKDVSSFLITARRSYADLFMVTGDMKDSRFHFYDVNARFDWRLSDNDRLSLSFINGEDVMGVTDIMDANWTNTSLSGRWLHYFSENMMGTSTAYYSSFDNSMGMEAMGTNYDQNGFIRHMGANYTWQWTMVPSLTWVTGLQTDYTWLKSAEWTVGNMTERSQNNAWENCFWVDGEWHPTAPLTLTAGLRAGVFAPEGNRTYVTWEPRFSANWKVNERHSIKMGYSNASQNIHAIMSNATSMPFNRYTMSSDIIKPERSNQLSLGYSAMTHNGAYDFSIEGYYKLTDNIYDYRDGKNQRSDINMDNIILGGNGRAYGVEFQLHKNHGNFTGWISYTLSWAENKIEGINGGRWYTASNDRRHDLSIVGIYQISNMWNMSGSWKYNTGQALTAPSAKYMLMDKWQYYYAERNGYRTPAYHRLDVSFNRTKKYRNYSATWSFGIYNLYGRSNPFMILFQDDITKPTGVKATKVSLLKFIPSVSYSVKF